MEQNVCNIMEMFTLLSSEDSFSQRYLIFQETWNLNRNLFKDVGTIMDVPQGN